MMVSMMALPDRTMVVLLNTHLVCVLYDVCVCVCPRCTLVRLAKITAYMCNWASTAVCGLEWRGYQNFRAEVPGNVLGVGMRSYRYTTGKVRV